MTEKGKNPFNLKILLELGSSNPEKKKTFSFSIGSDTKKLDDIAKEMELSEEDLLLFDDEREFYAQKPEIVAKGLIGANIIRTTGDKMIAGIVTGIDAWPTPVHERQRAAYSQEPGNVYIYSSPYGKFFAITAHEPQGTGVVRIKQVTFPSSEIEISSSNIVNEFSLADMHGKYVNGSDLFIMRMSLDPSYEIREIRPKAKDKFSAEYKAVRKK